MVTVRAFRNHHFSVAMTSAFSVAAGFSPAFAANMFYIYDEWVNVSPGYFYVVLVYMGLFVLFFLWAIPDQSRHMPRDLETIADHMALFSQSSLLDNGAFQIEVDILPTPTRATESKNILLRFKNWASSLMKRKNNLTATLRTIKNEGWKKAYNRFNKAVFGPPELIVKVLEELQKVSRSDPGNNPNGKVPRFGTWEKDGLYFVGIDYNEGRKMLSLLEKSYYEIKWTDVRKSFTEWMF